MNETTGKFLAQQLYPDLKNWIPTLFRTFAAPVKKRLASQWQSPSSLLDALQTNRIQADSWVSLRCKPSPFGPFLRTHFLSPPPIGHHTSMRLGPPLLHKNPYMSILGQATTHLKPVGLFPPIDENLYQLCLYPYDANVCGMIGILPGISKLISYIPAVASSKHTFFGTPCNVKGVIRQVPAKSFMDLNISIERWEECRQAGDIWFLD